MERKLQGRWEERWDIREGYKWRGKNKKEIIMINKEEEDKKGGKGKREGSKALVKHKRGGRNPLGKHKGE